MMKISQRLMMVVLGITVLLGCSAEEGDEPQMNSLHAVGTTSAVQVEDITPNDLLGTWDLVSMTSEKVPVDFNGDSEKNTDLLSETSCFNNMYFTFKADGTFDTRQARLFFDDQGDFSCSEKIYSASFEVTDNILSITFDVQGSTFTETRNISIESNGTSDFLHLSLTAIETDAAVYIAKGRQQTVAAAIEKIDFVYIRR